MSDELKPCPFCKSGCLYETQRNGYCDYTAVMFCNRCKAIVTWEQVEEEGVNEKTRQFVREHWNTRADDALEQPVDNEQADSRERIEEDMLNYVLGAAKLCHGMGLQHELWQFNPEPLHMCIRQYLDRQAAITKAENEESECTIVGAWDDYATELEDERDELRQQVDSLTAERYGLKARVKFQQSQIDASHLAFKIANEEYDKLDRKCDELKEEIAKYEHDCGLLFDEKHKLTADAKKWADAANEQRLVAMEQADKVQELTAERDLWKARAEQAQESYLDAKDSRDNLQAALKRERTEWESERDYADQCEERLKELTAECDKLRKYGKHCFNNHVDYEAEYLPAIKEFEAQVKDLEAERDQLSRDLTAEHALVAQFEHDNERLREAIDAMENGQFYATYRRTCEERDELKREHEQERQQMQRVIDTQRESFRKMEFELAQAKGGSDDEG